MPWSETEKRPGVSLSKQHLDALSERGKVRSYPRNSVIINEGDEGDTLYIILAGRVKIFLADEDGKEVILGTQGPGECFGEIVLDDGPRSASVATLEPSKFSVVGAEVFREYVMHTPEAAGQLVAALIHRVRELTRTVGVLALLDVYGRVVRLLEDLAVARGEELVVEERLTQQDIATRVGCSREMISRIFKELRQGGYIRPEPERIVILRKPPRAW